MHKFVRVLDNPPPIQEQTPQVSGFWGQSHGLTMRYKNLMINRFTSQWNTLFEYFHFCLEKLIFMRHLCRNPQFLGIFISIRHIWLSCWQDKYQIRLSLRRCQPLETLNQETVFFSLPPPPGKLTQPPMGMAKDIIWHLTWCTYYQNSKSSFWC